MTALEPLVSPGGFVIVDDYGHIEACRKAVHDYRTQNDITSPIEQIDYTGGLLAQDVDRRESGRSGNFDAVCHVAHSTWAVVTPLGESVSIGATT